MSDAEVETSYREIILHDDDETPLQFVIELLHSVFKKPLADAFRFTEEVRQEGNASCGRYPRDIASEMLEAARQRIDDSGHPLRITSRKAGGDNELFDKGCKLCGDLFADNRISLTGNVTIVCGDCMDAIRSKLLCRSAMPSCARPRSGPGASVPHSSRN